MTKPRTVPQTVTSDGRDRRKAKTDLVAERLQAVRPAPFFPLLLVLGPNNTNNTQHGWLCLFRFGVGVQARTDHPWTVPASERRNSPQLGQALFQVLDVAGFLPSNGKTLTGFSLPRVRQSTLLKEICEGPIG